MKNKRIYWIRYIEETLEILNEFLKENMTTTKKALAAALKNISTALHTLGTKLAPGLSWEYSIAKANYFYSKVGEDVKEWLAKIDHIIEVNNVANRRKVAIVVIHLKDIAAD